MPSFYKSIAHYYNEIFPLKPAKFTFTLDEAKQIGAKTILDVGCASGHLTNELSREGFFTVGIDLNDELISIAQENRVSDLSQFLTVNMLEIDKEFINRQFDLIISYGNTLVHLQSLEQIKQFLYKCYQSLHTGGKLLIQIINYDRILKQNIKALPTIENNRIRFERSYIHKNNIIEFKTKLLIKESGQSIVNSINLLPITKSELDGLLLTVGFKNIYYYGSFDKDPLTTNSMPLIFSAQK